MKHKAFYIYQVADIIFTSSCRSVGMLLAWVMINHHGLKVELGWFITLSWALQVITLITFSSLSERLNKKSILLICSALSVASLLILGFDQSVDPFKLGSIYVLTSILCIVIQPIGSSIVPTLYKGNHIERAFRIRGFVNLINTVLGAVFSGFIIKSLNNNDIITLIVALMSISFILFLSIKIEGDKTNKSIGCTQILAHVFFNNKIERLLVSISALSNFVLTPTIMYIAPILVVDKYNLSSLELGFSEATFGSGMIFGSMFFCKKVNKLLGVRHSTVLGIVLVSLGLLIVLTISSIYSLYIGFFVSGLGMVIYNINTTKIRCTATPVNIRNSFESIFIAICILPIPAGVAFSTYLIDFYRVEVLLAFFSISIFASSITVLRSKDFAVISSISEDKLDGYYSKMYPHAYLKSFDIAENKPPRAG
ncbi:MFS transporter [Vibrio ostreicida]|uniref:MFS transporter n=1 Tax=Vibrio ostreicida TaxID=526588 RepID=UPI003B5BA16F